MLTYFRFDTKSIKLVLADNSRPNLDKHAIVRRVKSVTIHENFHTYTFNNDIAIIEMDQPVDVNGIVRTACLPEDSEYTVSLRNYATTRATNGKKKTIRMIIYSNDYSHGAFE